MKSFIDNLQKLSIFIKKIFHEIIFQSLLKTRIISKKQSINQLTDVTTTFISMKNHIEIHMINAFEIFQQLPDKIP